MTLARSRTGKPNSGDGFVLQSGQLKKWQLNSRWLANKIDLLELKAKNNHVDLIIHSLNHVDGPTSQVIDICNFLNYKFTIFNFNINLKLLRIYVV